MINLIQRIKYLPLILLVVVNNVFALPDYRNISLANFASSVATANNINIFIDEDLSSENISFYIPTIKSAKTLFEAFKISVNKKGLNLVKKGNFYYLSKKKKYIVKNYAFNLSYNCSEDFKKYLDMLALKYVYFPSNNSFIVSCNYLQRENISKFLIRLDKQAKQVILKFIVLSYDDSIVRERGFQFGTVYKSLDGTIQSAVNALIFPISTGDNIISSTSFYNALKFLDTNNIINIDQYPYILVKNNNEFKFESVKNIPYLVNNTITDSTTVQNNNSYDYKDVGLKIKGKATIYEKFVTLDIELTIEDIINVSADEKTPSTNKRYLNSITNLKIGQVLLLSGIKQNKVENNHVEIPFLSGMPYIGDMFKYKYKSVSHSNITIAIQVLDTGANASLLPREVRTRGKER